MHTNPQRVMVRPTSPAIVRALPAEPWLNTTAGNGPGPSGTRMTPVNSYRTPSTDCRRDHGAPSGCRGSPAIVNAAESTVALGAADPPVVLGGAHAASESVATTQKRETAF